MKMRLAIFTNTKRLKGLLLLLMVLGFAIAIQAQTIHVTKGTQFPDSISGSKYNWYLNTDSMKAFAFKAGRWVLASHKGDSILDISACNEIVILHKWVWKKMVYVIHHPLGYQYETVFEYYCGEKILVQRNLNGYLQVGDNFFVGRNRYHPSLQYDCDLSVNPDTVQGMLAFCVPHYESYVDSQWYCEALRNWGMIGTNRQWLIEPKFDHFFYFENGIAEVVYAGKKRKINEKGKFVR